MIHICRRASSIDPEFCRGSFAQGSVWKRVAIILLATAYFAEHNAKQVILVSKAPAVISEAIDVAFGSKKATQFLFACRTLGGKKAASLAPSNQADGEAISNAEIGICQTTNVRRTTSFALRIG